MNRNDVRWSDFIISKMKEASPDFVVAEGKKEFPKIGGLRWAVRNYLGQFYAEKSYPPVALGMGVVCSYAVRCLLRDDVIEDENLRSPEEVHCGSADCTTENDGGNIYRTAYADTRAESRALVRLLALDRCSAEEFIKSSYKDEPNEEVSRPSKPDILQHEVLSKRVGIDLGKFYQEIGTKLKKGGDKEFKKFDPSNITRDQAIKFAEILNEYQQDKSKIPNSIK